MNCNSLSVRSLFVLLLVGFVSGCGVSKAQKDKAIDEMIEGAMSAQSAAKSAANGLLSDYKVYRDGDKDGVIYEFTFVEGAEIDRKMFNSDTIQPQMVKKFGADANTRKIFDMDIYLRAIYKTFEGEVLCDVKVSKADL